MAVATVVNILLLLLFLVAGIVSFSIYSKLIKWATKKFDLENRLDPILTPRKNRRDNRE